MTDAIRARRRCPCAVAVLLVALLLFASAPEAQAQAAATNSATLFWSAFAGLALFFAAGAGWMFHTASKFGALANASLSWPTVPGTVTESRVESKHHPKSGYSFIPVVVYDYAVGGTRYQSNVIEFGAMEMPLESTALTAIKNRPVGATVAVRYQPENPGIAALESSSAMAQARRVGGWIFVVLGAGFIGGLIYLRPYFGMP